MRWSTCRTSSTSSTSARCRPQEAPRQPSEDELQRAIAWLTDRIEQFQRDRTPASSETVLRRLNAREYRNTVRDLLHLNMTMFDPTRASPATRRAEHLDNVGESLVTSGYLLQRYLDAAERVTREGVLARPEARAVQTWSVPRQLPPAAGDRPGPPPDQWFQPDHALRRRRRGQARRGVRSDPGFKEGVPHDGFYELRIKAEALNRLHPYDPEFVGTDRDEPLRLGVVAGNQAAGPPAQAAADRAAPGRTRPGGRGAVVHGPRVAGCRLHARGSRSATASWTRGPCGAGW